MDRIVATGWEAKVVNYTQKLVDGALQTFTMAKLQKLALCRQKLSASGGMPQTR